MRLYVVYDTVAEKCFPVFEQDTDASAARTVSLARCPKGTKANDFKLLYVGNISSRGFIQAAVAEEISKPVLVMTFPAEDVNE